MSSSHAFAPPPESAPVSRRLQNIQPPLLTTSLGGVQHANAQMASQTPASATSLSTPFNSHYNATPYTASPNVSRRSAAHSSRNSMVFSGPYNPQEWGAGSMSASSPGGAQLYRATPRRAPVSSRNATGMEEVLASPPPPYSPRRPDQHQPSPSASNPADSPGMTVSPASNPSEYNTPISAATTISPGTSTGYSTGYPTRSPRPPSTIYPGSSPNVGSAATFPPPPPPSGRGSRSNSSTRPDRSQPTFSLASLTSRTRNHQSNPSQSAIDILQRQTAESLAQAPRSRPVSTVMVPNPGQNPVSSSPEYVNASLDVRPPGSRRAASTGHIGLPGTPSRSRADSLSPTRAAWAPGMPLPPPPPGPPPGSRSQSMTRAPYGERSSSDFPAPVAAPAPRRPLAHGTTLGPVPPTPSDWVEEDDSTRAAPPERRERDLQIDTQRDASNRRDEHNTPAESFYAAGSFAAPPQDTRAEREDGSPGLSRASARRDRTSKGIRERRSESRSGRARNLDGQTPVESRDNPFSFELEEVKPSDLVLPLTIAGRNRRRSPVRSRPGSAKTPHTGEGMRSSDSRRPSDPLESAGSNRSTPRPEYNQQNAGPDSLAYTPPFSPEAAKYHRVASISKTKSPALPPKALPTPPPQHYGVSSTNGKSYGRSPQDFHTSVEAAVPAPSPASRLTPSRLTPSQLTPSRRVQSDHSAEECESFMHSAIGRHRAFAEREAAASSDRERVEMFTEFIVAESRIRRKRYSRAMEQMSPGIEDLLRGLFRPPSPDQKLATTDSPGRAMGSLTSSHNQEQEGHEPNPNLDGKDSQPQGRPESSWWNSYLPSLSPIASMDNSTSHDELSSRGRPASRWWESEGSSENGARRTLERTQREAKYMSLVRDGKSLQWDEPRSSPSGRNGSGSFAGPSGNSVYGPNEYPPEKAGLPDSEMLPPPPPPKHPSPRSPPGPKLDVSRLVTLPPPYPRHYPAVNNNHPDLAAIRTTIRSLCPLASVKALKENYVASVAALREDAQRAANRRRSQTRSDIQRMIQAEEISFAEAAQIEADCEAAEIRATKERAQAEFDLFQKSVFNPSHASLSERIDKATTTIGEIRDMLTSIAQKRGPDLIQEEGDEHPELLEKLTQWKWCFETRELLYRELNDLQGERDDKFKAIVTAPYLLPKHAAKLAETEAFFARDAQDRKLAFEKDVLGRYEAFLNAMEDNVSRGVEVQLDAFYDIAPALLVLVQSIPPPHPAGPRSNNDLASLDIVIPACEYDENPAYHAYPLQYLHSLLTHAGRSMYTYIEAQTDLLCLLHEIKTAMMSASVRVVETERIIETQRALGASASNSSDASAGSRFDSNQTVQTQIAAISKEMEDIRREEERRVTDDLKDKVRVVEGLWEDGLGRAISDLKIRVRDVLVGMGGWEPGLDEAI